MQFGVSGLTGSRASLVKWLWVSDLDKVHIGLGVGIEAGASSLGLLWDLNEDSPYYII